MKKIISRCYGCGKLKLFPLMGVISSNEDSSIIEDHIVWICRRCHNKQCKMRGLSKWGDL